MNETNSTSARSSSTQLRHVIWATIDGLAWALTLVAATMSRLSFGENSQLPTGFLSLALLCSAATVALSLTPRFHHMRARRGSLEDAKNATLAWALVTPLVVVVNYWVLARPVPTSALLLSLPLALSLMLGARMVWRRAIDSVRPTLANIHPGTTRVVVLGAGLGGEQIIRAMQRDPESGYLPVALLDDDIALRTRSFQGVRVRGNRSKLAEVARNTGATELLIAIPSASSDLVREMEQMASAAGLGIRVLPTTSELLGRMRLSDIRELTPADLLGRDEVTVDLDSIRDYVSDKRVLVTGAGGSIGSELCRQLSSLNPSALLMLDRDESALHGVQLSIEGQALLDTPNLIVADIRDRERIDEIFDTYRPDVVFHTAALKHLTLLEQNPDEGVKTNVFGTRNLLEMAKKYGVSRFMNVSTDKAADPTSVLGATKLLAERLTSQTAIDADGTYVSVRFGNVLGSRGSVLPTFERQIANGGPITITDRDVTRYFMTIPEAVRLVLQAGAIGQAGEIMVLDMGEPVKINDLAEQLIRQSGKSIDITYTGLRPGEKLHEVLIASDEIGIVRQHEKITHTAGSTDMDISDLVTTELAGLIDLTGELTPLMARKHHPIGS